MDVNQIVEAIPSITKEIMNNSDLKISVGFSTSLWGEICDAKSILRPFGLREYKERKSERGDLPELGGDIFLHIKSDNGIEEAKKFEEKIISHLKIERVLSYESSRSTNQVDILDYKLLMDKSESEKRNISLVRKDGENNGGSFLLFQVWKHKPNFINNPKKYQKKIGYNHSTGFFHFYLIFIFI